MNVVVFNMFFKCLLMFGYWIGFVVGDGDLIVVFRCYWLNVGVVLLELV